MRLPTERLRRLHWRWRLFRARWGRAAPAGLLGATVCLAVGVLASAVAGWYGLGFGWVLGAVAALVVALGIVAETLD